MAICRKLKQVSTWIYLIPVKKLHPYQPVDQSDQDEWSKFAPAFMKLATNGPSTIPAADMVRVANAEYPLASALTVLDIGCGPGQVTDAVLKASGDSLPSSARIVASDLAPGILEEVKKRKKEEVVAGNMRWSRVEVMQCDAMDLSAFADGSVSHAFADFVLFGLPQPRVALQEVRRVLTDKHGGGVLALSS